MNVFELWLYAVLALAVLTVLVPMIMAKPVAPSAAPDESFEPGWTETSVGADGLAYGVEEAGGDASPHREEAEWVAPLNPNVG